MNKCDIRCCVFGMDARREAQQMVIPFASFATRQTPEYAATLRAGDEGLHSIDSPLPAVFWEVLSRANTALDARGFIAYADPIRMAVRSTHLYSSKMNKAQQFPHDLLHRLRVLDVLDRITQVSLACENMEDVLSGVLDLALEVFNADRAWFVYPCDPDAPCWGVPMERTRPEWPGLFARGVDMPMDSALSEVCRELLSVNGAIQYGPDSDHRVPHVSVEQFSVKSQVQIALRPKIGKSWVFGLHHCASAVLHDEQDMHLFTAVALRISDSLSSLISIRQHRESEAQLRAFLDNSAVIGWLKDVDGRYEFVSDNFLKRFAFSRDAVIGKTEQEIWPQAIADEHCGSDRALLDRGSPLEVVETMRNPDDSISWWLSNKFICKTYAGKRLLGGLAVDITARKQAEAEQEITLRKVERTQSMLQNVLDSTPDWIFAKDTNYRFLFVNRAFATSQGCTPQDMAGRPDTDFWPAELCNGDPARGIRGLHADDDAAMAGKLIHNPSDPATLGDGKLHFFDTLKLPLLDADGHCYGVLCYARDVTERKDAEQLRFSEALLRQTQSMASIGSWQINVQHNALVWSDETYRIFGIAAGTPLNHERFLDQIHPDDRSLVDSAWQAALRGAPYLIQHRIVVDGETRWVEERAQLDFDAQGNLYACTGSVQDITGRKQAETALLESEAKFRSIIEATPVPLALNDDNGNITYLNKAFVQIIGYTTDDIPTLTDWWPRAYPDPQYRQWVAKNWQNNLEEARRSNGAFDPIEVNIRCKDGSTRTFMAGAASIKESFYGTHLVILYDITVSKAAAEEIQYLAFYDPLTRLPNRRLLLDRLQQALASSARSCRKGALLFIDLDNFKTLNDTLGHDTGDLLLQQVAQRLEPCVRNGDTVARLGGDEFVVILEDLSEQALEAAAQAEAVGEKIFATLRQPYQLATHERHSTPSIGVTLFNAYQSGIEKVKLLTGVALKPNIPIFGFARRMTAYKRPDLLFSDLDRLRAIARNHPFQIILAGKAHPHDENGKQIIAQLHAHARVLAGAIQVVYLPDYDMSLAQTLTAGTDVWLNTPLPPLEASGTSGMKAAFNGVPNLSVLDGWWIEGCIEGVTGWAIGDTAGMADGNARVLYDKLEQVVLPLYFSDDHGGWIKVMKGAICKNASYFNSHRMMRRYATEAYSR